MSRFVLSPVVAVPPSSASSVDPASATEPVREPSGGFYVATSGVDPFGNTTSIEWDAHTLFVTRLTDAIGNVVEAIHDYRVLAPSLLTDANGNRTAVAFDTRGVVIATATMGKVGAGEGDTLAEPTATFAYDPFAWRDDGVPISTRTLARETYGDPTTRWLTRIVYADGSGHPILEKVNAEPGMAPQRDGNGSLTLDGNGAPVLVNSDPRWVGTGRTVFDNKGNPVKQYEPYFSSTDAYEDEAELREQGVTPLLHYDPLGRLVRTDLPDGTHSRVTFSPWHVEHWDPNDTAAGSSWYAERVALPVGDPRRRAAESTDPHHDTPALTRYDALGRPVVSVADLGGGVTLLTRVALDVEGNVLSVTDARGNVAQSTTYGMLGQPLRGESVDAGQQRTMLDAMGSPLRAFDDPALGRSHRIEYDALRRPTHQWLQPAAGPEQLLSRTIYGETAPTPELNNLRGQRLRVYDSAGLAVSHGFDFAGNPLQNDRTFVVAYDSTPDWVALAAQTTLAGLDTAAAPLLQTEVFSTTGTFDAFGRPVTQTTPEASVTRYRYNDAGLLQDVQAEVRGATPATTYVSNIDYDVHGRRARVDHGNGTHTESIYDPLTFRLSRITTTRISDSAVLQDLQYTYDAVGNIVEIGDGAQQAVYFDNTVVSPDQQFVYDAVYRLVEATGREHTSQGQPTHSELTPGTQPHTSDPAALRRYTETYSYDAVGNITLLQHAANGGNWTRGYAYAASGNRLVSNSLPGDTPADPATHSATYAYNPHGSMTAMPHLAAIDWDHAERMRHADLGGGGDVYFQYDAAGTRVRKVVVNAAGTQTEERLYLGAVELYRERTGTTLNAERQTLHIADDTARIAIVETLTVDAGSTLSSPPNIARYQHANHLSTVSIELDDAANVISYEEFHPYGTSAYRAVDSTIAVSAKRYRYAGKERDHETGLDHMGARLYAPWLARWTSTDPIGLGDGVNRYAYVSGNPVAMSDPSGTKGTKLDELGADLNAAATELARQGDNPDVAAQDDFQTANAAFHAELGRHEAKRSLGPSRGQLAPIASDLPHFRGQVSQSYDEAVEGFSDPTNPTLARAAFLGLATVMSPLALVDKSGEAALNAPRNADIAGQLAGRASLQQDPLLAADDFAASFSVFAEAFTGAGTVAVPLLAGPRTPASAAAADLGTIADDAARAAGRGPGKFGPDDVAFGVTVADGQPGALVKFGGEATLGTGAPLSEATQALAPGLQRNLSIANDTLGFARDTLRANGGRLRFNLTGFDPKQALTPGSKNFDAVTSAEFRGILNDAFLRRQTDFFRGGKNVTNEILKLARPGR